MAKAYAPPKGYDFKFDFSVNTDWNEYDKAQEAYIERLRKWCKKHTNSSNPLVGETIRTPRADGYAIYMVFLTKPLTLIHVPVGDAWNADPAWIRGIRLKDVKEMVENDKELAKLFGGED